MLTMQDQPSAPTSRSRTWIPAVSSSLERVTGAVLAWRLVLPIPDVLPIE